VLSGYGRGGVLAHVLAAKILAHVEAEIAQAQVSLDVLALTKEKVC
jgi:BarA-like signal transduction histidine kinase